MYNNDGSSVTERELERIDSRLYTPAQSVHDLFATLTPEVVPVAAGKLSQEHAAILNQLEEGFDAREFSYLLNSGQGWEAAFKAAGGTSSSMFHKTVSTGSLFKRVPFKKVDESKREVWGIVTSECPDADLEICDYASSKPHYDEWVNQFKQSTGGESLGNLREMHQLSAVGRAIGYDPRDASKEIWMGFKVIDDTAWRKVLERVYTGFSHGGEKVGPMWPDSINKACQRYTAKPMEVSLVDNPCLKEATYTLVRADGREEVVKIAA